MFLLVVLTVACVLALCAIAVWSLVERASTHDDLL